MNQQHKNIFVTGIGTNIGKTLVSAILVEAMQADYWKPVQAGNLDESDTMLVKSLVSNAKSAFHPEAYRLSQPLSPHAAAPIDNIKIDPDSILVPQTTNTLVIEGAGGVMVPLNDTYLVIDLIAKLNAEVVIVSQNYLGSINHTLLTVDALKQRGIKIRGIIFNGNAVPASEDFILRNTGLRCLGKIPQLQTINKKAIVEAGQYLDLNM